MTEQNRTEQNRTEQNRTVKNICHNMSIHIWHKVTKDYSKSDPVLIGGIGEKKSNGGTQYFTQNRIYKTDSVSTSITTCCLPFYLVVEK